MKEKARKSTKCRLRRDLQHRNCLHLWRFSFWMFLIVLLNVAGCDNLLTKPPPEGDDFETPFDELSFDLNRTFALGDEAFEKVFTVEEGLGPIFNNTGCESCHPADGRGTPNQAFFRFSIGNDLAIDIGGAQHQDRSIPGVPLEVLPEGVDKSRRLPPPVFGMGLIEAILVETILSYADEADADGDGISGRPNWVTAPDYVPSTEVGGGPGQQLGRFSRKAQVSSLIQQVSEAYQQDIGITSDFISVENSHPQAGGFAVGDTVPIRRFHQPCWRLSFIAAALAAQTGEMTSVKEGEQIEEIGCAACHVPTMRTGPHFIALDRVVEMAGSIREW